MTKRRISIITSIMFIFTFIVGIIPIRFNTNAEKNSLNGGIYSSIYSDITISSFNVAYSIQIYDNGHINIRVYGESSRFINNSFSISPLVFSTDDIYPLVEFGKNQYQENYYRVSKNTTSYNGVDNTYYIQDGRLRSDENRDRYEWVSYRFIILFNNNEMDDVIPISIDLYIRPSTTSTLIPLYVFGDYYEINYNSLLNLKNQPNIVEIVGSTLGDVNGDNLITAVDASKILTLYATINEGNIDITDKELDICDINKDGLINAIDASFILRYYAYLNDGGNKTLEEFTTSTSSISTTTTTTTTTITTNYESSYVISGTIEAYNSEYYPNESYDSYSWVYDGKTITISGNGAIGSLCNIREAIVNINRNIGFDFDETELNIVINEGITKINDYFSYPYHIASVELPSTLEVIDDYAFVNADFDTISLPNSLTYIGNHAFHGCDNLNSLIIPNSVTYLGDNAISRCSNLKSITIPKFITEIGLNLFVGCDNLESVMVLNDNIAIYDKGYPCCPQLFHIYNANGEETMSVMGGHIVNNKITIE